MDEFNLSALPEGYLPRYNIAPGQPALVVRDGGGRRQADLFRWGLIPAWSEDPRIAYKLIIARSETAAGKPAFRSAFQSRRCVVPADGFYEWRKQGKVKVPFRFRLRNGRPFALAGLWESWHAPDGERVQSFTILTTAPNDLVKHVYNRMPCMLRPDTIDLWLGCDVPGDAAHSLLRPYPAEEMEAYKVSPVVNSPRNDSEACVQWVQLNRHGSDSP